jgi:hypothetical protein
VPPAEPGALVDVVLPPPFVDGEDGADGASEGAEGDGPVDGAPGNEGRGSGRAGLPLPPPVNPESAPPTVPPMLLAAPPTPPTSPPTGLPSGAGDGLVEALPEGEEVGAAGIGSCAATVVTMPLTHCRVLGRAVRLLQRLPMAGAGSPGTLTPAYAGLAARASVNVPAATLEITHSRRTDLLQDTPADLLRWGFSTHNDGVRKR